MGKRKYIFIIILFMIFILVIIIIVFIENIFDNYILNGKIVLIVLFFIIFVMLIIILYECIKFWKKNWNKYFNNKILIVIDNI